MILQGPASYSNTFSSTSTISVTHNLGQRRNLWVWIIINDEVRADLISSIDLDPSDPDNKLSIALSGSYSGTYYILEGKGIKVNESSSAETPNTEQIRIRVRNESGSPISSGKVVAVVGFDGVNNLPLIDLADKDDGGYRPAVGITTHSIADNTNDQIVSFGMVDGLNTSSWSINDQLVLGNSGSLIRPYPETNPFTGETQDIASVVKVDAVDGIIFLTSHQNLSAGTSRCRVYRTSSQPIATSSPTAVIFQAAATDTDSMFNAGLNPTRITIPYTDDWLIVGNAVFETSATGDRGIYLSVNGITETINIYKSTNNPSLTAISSIPRIRHLTVGSYVELIVTQDSGSDKNLISGDGYTTLEVTRIGN